MTAIDEPTETLPHWDLTPFFPSMTWPPLMSR